MEKIFNDPEMQDTYERRVDQLKKAFRKEMKSFYKPAFHDEPIEQIARCEISIRNLERIIQSGDIVDDSPMKEKQAYERHLRSLYDQMQINMKGQRGDVKNINMTASRDFKEFMAKSLGDMLDLDEEEEEDEED